MSFLQSLFGGKRAGERIQASSKYVPKRVRPDELSAGAYLRPDMIIFHGICETESGGYNCGPYRTLETSVTDAILGAEALQIMKDASATPIPDHLPTEQQKLLAACKIRSYSKLCEGAVHCTLHLRKNEISFLPTRREGRGFVHLPDLTVKIPAASTAEALGQALRKCFQNCH